MQTNNAIYEFFKQKLRDESYAIGDVYSAEDVQRAQEEWNIVS